MNEQEEQPWIPKGADQSQEDHIDADDYDWDGAVVTREGEEWKPVLYALLCMAILAFGVWFWTDGINDGHGYSDPGHSRLAWGIQHSGIYNIAYWLAQPMPTNSSCTAISTGYIESICTVR